MMNALAVSDTAEIKSVDYEVRQDMLVLGVRIDYNFTANNKLKVIVDSYSPRRVVSRIIDVKSGLGTTTVNMEMDSVSLNENWRATLSLRLTNENGENLDLLSARGYCDFSFCMYIWWGRVGDRIRSGLLCLRAAIAMMYEAITHNVTWMVAFSSPLVLS